MATESAAKKSQKDLADIAVEKYVTNDKKETQQAEETEQNSLTEKFANIESNPFHQIVVQSDATPNEKKEAVAKILIYDKEETKEGNDAQIAAFEEFKEYLMTYRKEVAKEIIRLSNAEVFSELQAVFEDMNGSLLDFEERISPLVDIIDAVHRLNMVSDGSMYDVFKEIQEDKVEEKRLAELRIEQEARLQDHNDEIVGLQQDIAAFREEKSWFGLGGTTKSALQEIARKEVLLQNKNDDLKTLRQEIETTGATRDTKFKEFVQEKKRLRELLDITSAEHKERQEGLVKAALNFVETTEERTGSVLSHMTEIKGQIKNVETVNGNMKRIFAVVTDGIKDAEEVNTDLTGSFQKKGEDEGQLELLEREDMLQAINEHVETLNASKLDTLSTLGELQEESMNIKSMRDTNNQQVNHARKMHSGGTAGVASRLSTVLTAVSSAALNEARTTTQNTLSTMNTFTQEISKNEAIKNATQLHVQNDEFSKAIDALASYKDVSDKATQITRAALEEQKELQREMEATTTELANSIKQSKGVTAEVMQNNEEEVNEEQIVADSSETGSPKSVFEEFKL